MNDYITKIDKKITEDWKFAIKNALLIVAVPFISMFVSILVILPFEFIESITSFRVLWFGIQGLYYIIGLFLFALMLFKVILNFFDYYKEKYLS